MTAIPILIKYSPERFDFKNGEFVKLPIELRDSHRVREYLKFKTVGWAIDDFGYAALTAILPTGALIIAPGLIVPGIAKVRKKIYGYSDPVEKSIIENIVNDYVELIKDQIYDEERTTRLLVHDLRAISGSIYSSAEEGLTLATSGNLAETKVRLQNVIAMQGILRMRIDALDFLTDTYDYDDDNRIPVYKKVDKVVRCFKSAASKEGKSIYLDGQSTGLVSGPNIFELVPYALIDNALKYSPELGRVDVYAIDSQNVRFTVRSYGPKIRQSESLNIWNRGTRGLAAISSAKPGSGLGLFMAKVIVEQYYGGSIEVYQEKNAININGQEYYETSFQVDLPFG